MILLEDTRQQQSKHSIKHQWFMENRIYISRVCLTCGDYQLPGDASIAVDTKKDIQELIGDIQFKAMGKTEIVHRIAEIWSSYEIKFLEPNNMYYLITDDDADRFAEKEISDYCFQNNVPEGALKRFQELYVKRHGFFHRGLIRAKNYGVKLYILVENKDGVTDIDSLFHWVNPRRKILVRTNEVIGWTKNGNPKYKRAQKYPNCMMGDQLAKACLTMEKKYGCTFLFCKPEEAGYKIIELLSETDMIKD